MKKRIVLIALIGMSLGVNAQNETVNGDLTVKGYINLRKSDNSGTGGFNISGSGTYIHLSGAGLISKTDNQQDLGVSSYRFKNLWLGSNAYINGNVGIGTTTPNAKLHVGSGYIKVVDDTYNDWFLMKERSDATHRTGFKTHDNASFSIWVDNSEKMRISKTGNVGIGTTAPGAKLEVKTGLGEYIRVNSSDATINANNKFGYKISELGIDVGAFFYTRDGQGVLRLNTLLNNDIAFGTNNVEKMRISKAGNVGIGTTNPSEKFEIVDHNASLRIRSTTPANNATLKLDWGINHGHHISYNPNTAITYFDSKHNIESNKVYSDVLFRRSVNNIMSPTFVIKGYTGNVGIGTTTPDAKLAVNGKIHTKEVKVDLVGWPDYVFQKEYKLPTLKEVEKHIKEKGHLKNIPSEKEVLKNGIQLGEMNAKLLQKIEELTLYTIAQEKELKRKDKELKKLSERLSVIEKLLNKNNK